jgi:hypothetical protein
MAAVFLYLSLSCTSNSSDTKRRFLYMTQESVDHTKSLSHSDLQSLFYIESYKLLKGKGKIVPLLN